MSNNYSKVIERGVLHFLQIGHKLSVSTSEHAVH